MVQELSKDDGFGPLLKALRKAHGMSQSALADRVGIDGAVNGVATGVRETSGTLRRLQNGLVRTYAVGIAIGAVLLMAYFLLMAKAG